ncbi:MAG: lipopolysaccharide biosynthesis protein [Allosphingosinicella sp.]
MGEGGERLIMRGAQASAAGFVVRLAARLLFLLAAGRLFGPAAFGAFAVAVAAVELVVAAGSLGTKKTAFQLLEGGGQSERPAAHRLLDLALLVAAASLALSLLVMAAAALVPSTILRPATAAALIMLVPMAAGQALLDLFLAATRWKQAIRYEVVARSVVEPWSLLAGCGLAWLLGWRAEGLAIGYWCGTLAALAYAVFAARRQFGGFRLSGYRPATGRFARILGRSASNASTDLVNGLYMRADLFLVGILLGEAAAGLYGMARQIVAPLRQVRQSFDGLLIPLVAKRLATRGSGASSEALASATRLILILQLPYLLAVVVVGRPLLDWMGPGFEAAYAAMAILAIAETLQSAFSIGDLVFVYLRPGLGLRMTLVSIGVGVAAALLLIPPFGIAGAALSVLAAHGVRAALRSRLLRSRFQFSAGLAHQLGPVAAAALAAAVGVAIGSPPLFALAASLAAYTAAVLLWAKAGRHSLGLAGFTATD